MALIVPCSSDKIISTNEFLERASKEVDLADVATIASAAQWLRALANDRALVVKKLNERVQEVFHANQPTSAQSIVLGKLEHVYVRANIWPANSDMTNGRAYQNQFAYNLAHDHNFTFMTLNYLGPGYETELYEYDYEKVQGYVGEQVELQFADKIKFGVGNAMIYRAGRDVHIQYAPEELTVTLNLMIIDPQQQLRDQYYFDVVKKTIAGYPEDLLATRRSSLVALAGFLGNADTQQILTDLAETHPCRRTRLAAYEALSRQLPRQAERIWEMACRDQAPLVSTTAVRRLKEFESSTS